MEGLTSSSFGFGTEMHFALQSTSPSLQAARQRVMAAWSEDWADEGAVVDWAAARAAKPARRRVVARIFGVVVGGWLVLGRRVGLFVGLEVYLVVLVFVEEKEGESTKKFTSREKKGYGAVMVVVECVVDRGGRRWILISAPRRAKRDALPAFLSLPR